MDQLDRARKEKDVALEEFITEQVTTVLTMAILAMAILAMAIPSITTAKCASWKQAKGKLEVVRGKLKARAS